MLDLIFKIAFAMFLIAMCVLLFQGSLAKATVIAPIRRLVSRIQKRRAYRRSLAFQLTLEQQRASANDWLCLLPPAKADYIRARVDLHYSCADYGHPEWSHGIPKELAA